VRLEGVKVMVTLPEPFPASHKRTPSMVRHCPDVDNRIFLIVGGGPAGCAAAQALREVLVPVQFPSRPAHRACHHVCVCFCGVKDGFRGKIRIISGETRLPYDRTQVSKELKTEPDLLHEPSFFTANNIEVSVAKRIPCVFHIQRHNDA
jgi:apoptosis-inducing factor 3